MTQPDGLFPDTSANYDSLAALAAKTQEEWENDLKGKTADPFLKFLSGMFGGLPADLQAGIDYTRALLTALARTILNIPTAIYDTVESAAKAVGDFVNGLWQGFSQFLDILAGAVVTPINAAIQAAKDWFATLLGFQQNTETTQINLQNFQITALTTGQRNPAWAFRYPVGDVSYMEVMNAEFTTFGTTGAQSAGTAHTHAIDGNSVKSAPNVWAIVPNNARGALIPAQATTIYDTVCCSVRKDVIADTLNNVFLEVFKQSADGSISRVHSVDISSKITSDSAQYIEESMPGAIVQFGEKFLARVRNATTTGKTIYVAGISQAAWVSDTSAAFVGSSESNKTVYTASELNGHLAAGTILPWLGLAAKNLATTDRSWSDDFNRSALGAMWSCRSNTGSNQLGIVNNKLTYIGLTDGHQNGIQITAMAGDANMITGDIDLDILAAGRELGLLLHCDSTMDQVVFLAVSSVGAKFYSGSVTSLMERATDTTGGKGTWSAYYDLANDKYVALKNGLPTGLEWKSVGSAVKHDSDHRYGGGRITRSSFVTAGVIDNVTLRDWKP